MDKLIFCDSVKLKLFFPKGNTNLQYKETITKYVCLCIISLRSRVILFIKTTKLCSTRINKYTSTLKGLLFCGFSLKQKQFTPLILAPPITGYNLDKSVNQTETEFKSSNIYWVLLPTGDVFALIIGVSANPLWPFCLFYFIFTLCKKICVNLVYRYVT